jgi:hypothetical protein
MQQYQQYTKVSKSKIVTTESKNLVEQQLIAVVNRLAEQTELQARQIRRLESELSLLRESLRSNKH